MFSSRIKIFSVRNTRNMSRNALPRVVCDSCKTINMANQFVSRSPSDYGTPCVKHCELPLQPTAIKICTSKEFITLKTGLRPAVIVKPYYDHGLLMWAVKTGILVGTIVFTVQQGVWGSQLETVECLRRWQEYINQLPMRKPPKFDKCGKVIPAPADPYRNFMVPIWEFYKSIITTCFSGVLKVPLLIKCSIINYRLELEKQRLEKEQEDAMKKKK